MAHQSKCPLCWLLIPGCSDLVALSYQNLLLCVGSCYLGKAEGWWVDHQELNAFIQKQYKFLLFSFYWPIWTAMSNFKGQGSTILCLPSSRGDWDIGNHLSSLPHCPAWGLGIMNFKSDTPSFWVPALPFTKTSHSISLSHFFSLCKMKMTCVLPVETQMN